jgi:hypothetical protein
MEEVASVATSGGAFPVGHVLRLDETGEAHRATGDGRLAGKVVVST